MIGGEACMSSLNAGVYGNSNHNQEGFATETPCISSTISQFIVWQKIGDMKHRILTTTNE